MDSLLAINCCFPRLHRLGLALHSVCKCYTRSLWDCVVTETRGSEIVLEIANDDIVHCTTGG